MNNENMNPYYKGRFLKNIVSDYGLEYLEFDEGTILIQETDEIKVFFQLKSDYIYYNEWSNKFLSRSMNHPMELLPGSAIDSTGSLIPDSQKFCLVQHVRVPMDGELEWYESQNLI